MAPTKLSLAALAAALALIAAPAAAEEDSDAAAAIGLPGTLGLTGFRDMVDARTPGTLSIRAGVRYDVTVRDRDFDGAVDVVREEQRHEVVLYAGGSLLGLVDVAGRLPWVYDRTKSDRRNFADLVDKDRGWGDFDLAAKVTLGLGPFSVAPFVFGRFPTGEPAVRDLARFEYGLAGTFSVLNEYVAVHGNVAGLQEEKGLSAIRYRVGVSFVVLATDALLLRVYGYGDGIEFEGRADSDIDLEFGGQAILFEFITAELGASVRIIDAGHLDDSLKQELREDLGVFDRHFDDEGTWSIQLGVGVLF